MESLYLITHVNRKGGLLSFVEIRVCHLMSIGVSFEQKHAV